MSARALPGVVGRGELVEELMRFILSAVPGGPPMLLLVGGEGVGKSFLLRHVGLAARSSGIFVLGGQTQASDIPQPFYLLQRILHSLMDLTAGDEGMANATRGGGSVALMGSYSKDRKSVPMLLLPLGLSTESPEEREARLLATLSGRESDEEEEQMALFDRLADHFEEAAGERRLLLVLDDLHYADRASIEFLEYFARRAKGRNIKIIGTSRPEDESPERLLTSIAALTREGLVRKLPVRGLTESETKEFLTHVRRGFHPSEATMTEWFTISGGNPLVLEQLTRVGTVSPARTGESLAKAHPESLLTSLSGPERKALSYATVIGRSFKFHTLYRALGGDEEKLTEIIDAFIQRGILKERSTEVYEFASDDLWTESFNYLTERHRRILHAKIAGAIEAMEGSDPVSVFELGNHYHAARNFEKSLRYNRQAADLAKKSRDGEAQVHYLEQALAALRALPTRDRRSEEAMIIELALSLDIVGEVERALQLLQSNLSPGLVTLYYARLLTHAGRWREAEELVIGSFSAIHETMDPALTGMAYRMLGSISTYRGEFAKAAENYEKAVPYLMQAGMKADAAIARLMLADKKRVLSGADEESITAAYEGAIADLRELDNPSLLATALMNYGLWFTERSMMEDALRYLEEALHEAESSGDARLTGWALFNTADVLVTIGDPERANDLNQQAKGRLTRVGDKLGLIQVHLVQGRLLGQKGEFTGAELEILEAFRLAKEVGFEPDQMEVLFRQGELYLLKGDGEGARKRLEEIEAHHFEELRPDLKQDIDRFRKAVRHEE